MQQERGGGGSLGERAMRKKEKRQGGRRRDPLTLVWQANLRVSKTPEFSPFTLSYFLLLPRPLDYTDFWPPLGAHHPCVCIDNGI
jgi:hypothetical protein